MDLHNDLHINSITETYSNRFGVKKITCSVRLTGPDIIGALDCLIQKVVNNTDDYFKVGLSISTNKSNLYIEFRPKDSLTDFPTAATDDQLFPKIPNLQSLKITMSSQTEFYNASNETPPGERYYEKVDTIDSDDDLNFLHEAVIEAEAAQYREEGVEADNVVQNDIEVHASQEEEGVEEEGETASREGGEGAAQEEEEIQIVDQISYSPISDASSSPVSCQMDDCIACPQHANENPSKKRRIDAQFINNNPISQDMFETPAVEQCTEPPPLGATPPPPLGGDADTVGANDTLAAAGSVFFGLEDILNISICVCEPKKENCVDCKGIEWETCTIDDTHIPPYQPPTTTTQVIVSPETALVDSLLSTLLASQPIGPQLSSSNTQIMNNNASRPRNGKPSMIPPPIPQQIPIPPQQIPIPPQQNQPIQKISMICAFAAKIRARDERRQRRRAAMQASTYSLQERIHRVSERLRACLAEDLEMQSAQLQIQSDQELSTVLTQMAAFSAGQSTILPSIDDDSGGEESSKTICDTREDLIQPLLVVIDETEGHVSNIEDCVRANRGIASNRIIDNQTTNGRNEGGGGGWVIGSNKNKKYLPHPSPKNTIVNPSTNTHTVVLNKSHCNMVSNVSLCNETQVSGKGPIPPSVSICNRAKTLGNETQVSGNKQLNADKPAIFVSSNSTSDVEENKNVVQIGKEKSTVKKITENICNTTLSNSNHHERENNYNSGFFENVPSSPPPKLPLRACSGWEGENSCDNISETDSQNSDIGERNYMLPEGSVDPLRGKVIFSEKKRNFAIFEKYERESDLFSVIKCTYTVCIRPKWNADESLFKLFMHFLDLVNARIHSEYESLCDVSYINIKIANTIDTRYECLSKFQKFDHSVLSALIDDVSTQVQSSNYFHFDDLIVTVKFVREPSGHGLESHSMNVPADPVISSLVNIHLTDNRDCLFRSIAYYTLYNERINLPRKHIKRNQITDRAWRLSRKCGMPLAIDASPRLLEQIACTLGVRAYRR
ncbi:unnamed protein product [Rotaria socialis]|uniref:Uncharacterized protein n=1 Tax=Rotaria socialis TaxID=392032 RepID=A0A821RN81_9BILA|nr:unnamed protein product [Rotaria socialis]